VVDTGKTSAQIKRWEENMPANRSTHVNAPDDVRRELAVQLRIERAHLAAIPADGLYRLREQLNVDELTGALGRRAGMAALQEAIARIRLSGNRELALAFIDVDGLEHVNDTRGHARGDLMLMALADVLKATLRQEDIVFRYGGDEFVCGLPFTSVGVAGDLLLRAWHTHDGLGWCSFSAGFAELREDDDAAALIARADDCLYAGRRRRARDAWRIAR
jgi:diguanylate cyclase (GGDEF)-like protein